MNSQPDFRKLFIDYFGGNSKKVKYDVRRDSNRYHDLVFLNSLIHDSRFKQINIILRGKKLTIPIERDCWEIFSDSSTELPVASSKLIISPVRSIEWRFDNNLKFTKDLELWIMTIYLTRIENDMMKLEIDGDKWSCHMIVSDDDLIIRVQDLEVPKYYENQDRT